METRLFIVLTTMMFMLSLLITTFSSVINTKVEKLIELHEADTIYVRDTVNHYYLIPSKADILLMGRLARSECYNQTMYGQIAVCEVVLNKLKQPKYRTLEQVIFAEGQFDGINTKYFYRTPTQQQIIAATVALSGSDLLDDDVIFYLNEDIATDRNWLRYLQKKKQLFEHIQDHSFYCK